MEKNIVKDLRDEIRKALDDEEILEPPTPANCTVFIKEEDRETELHCLIKQEEDPLHTEPDKTQQGKKT